MSAKATEGALVGRFERKLDAARRISIPSEWFVVMGQPKRVVVMPHPEEPCLVLMTEQTLAAEIRAQKRMSTKSRKACKPLPDIEAEVERLDVNSRRSIRISGRLLKYAKIRQRMVLIGNIRCIKIWNPATLRKEESESDPLYDEIEKEIQAHSASR